MKHIHYRIGTLLGTGLALFLVCALAGQAVAQTCAQVPNGLVSWWPGDGNAEDIQNGNDGTLQNDAGFAPGQVGQAFSLDGMDDHVFVGNPINLQLQDFTIDAWIKLNTLALAPTSCPLIVTYGQGGYGFGVSSGSVRCQSGGGGLNPVGVRELFLTKIGFNAVSSQGVVILDTDWHHVAVTKSAGAVTFYLDGIGQNVPISYDPGFLFATNLAIGIRQDILQDAFPGVIDEVELFNRALSAAEIQALYNAGSTGKCRYTFQGFFPPVDNLPTLNRVKAGRAIPVKFSLGGDEGLSIFAPDYPKSQALSCASIAPVDDIEETVTAGSSALSYDATTDMYTYVWKTDKAWAATCRQLMMKFKDGSDHRATFSFE
jgi:hypothetical protein